MNHVLNIILLTLLQFATGFGILTLTRIALKKGIFIPLCLLTGVAVLSVVPFLLQLFYIPITHWSVFGALLIVCTLLNWRWRRGIARIREHWRNSKFRFKLYEIPALLVITAIVVISVWRCFYLPPTPRDLNSGPEAIAQYALREGTLINSVFSVDVSNNVFKSTFITSLQVIYKMAGFAFGQLWLSTIFVSFIFFLYHALREQVHRLIAGLLIIFLLAIPEMYGYTFMVLYDYSNAVFFCCSVYLLFRFFENQQRNYLVFAALLMGVATYIRSETLVLAFLLLPLIVANGMKDKMPLGRISIACLLFVLPLLLLYILSVPVYIKFYLPANYPISEQINNRLTDLRPFFRRLSAINSELIFSETGINYYGYFIFIFLVVLVADLLIIRRTSRESTHWLYAIMVIYLGMPLLGYLLPLLDLHNSTKRGLLKMFPLMLMYMGNTGLFIELTKRIRRWERRGR